MAFYNGPYKNFLKSSMFPSNLDIKFTRFWVRNFKSLRDIELELRDFNLLVGPNASGKTNIVEVFKLLRKIYSPESRVINPFLEWWGYTNVVWRGLEELPITLGLELAIQKYIVRFEVMITGAGGRFEVLRESLEIVGYVKVTRDGSSFIVEHERDFIEHIWEKIRELSQERQAISKLLFSRPQVSKIDISNDIGHPLAIRGMSATYKTDVALVRPYVPVVEGEKEPLLLSPIIKTHIIFKRGGKINWESHVEPLFTYLLGILRFPRLICLRQFTFSEIRKPQLVRGESILSEDCSNLSNVFHTIFMEKGLPERVQAALDAIFSRNGSNISIRPELTSDGRVYIKVLEDGLELEPTMVADGLWKVLGIILAIETKPILIVIDELENSLHPLALEYIVNELKNAGCTVIATTHSPAVVDIVEPEDLVLVDRDEEGATQVKRISDPEALRRWMVERGVTLSESWLYGRP